MSEMKMWTELQLNGLWLSGQSGDNWGAQRGPLQDGETGPFLLWVRQEIQLTEGRVATEISGDVWAIGASQGAPPAHGLTEVTGPL